MRDEKLDFLRFLGLAMIILAHAGPPSVIAQLRNFDVPLMVLVSGASFSLSYKREPYASYVWKRIKRLLFPTWIFLTIYFLSLFALSVAGLSARLPEKRAIVDSYLLLWGIGYVWIIRVFLMVAIVSPAIRRFSKNTPSHARFFLILGAAYVAYEIVLFLTKPYLATAVGTYFGYTVLYLVPYAILFAVGFRLVSLTRGNVFCVAAVALVIFLCCAVIYGCEYGKPVATQGFKYPPPAYYLSYALLASCIAWLSSGTVVNIIKRAGLIKPVLFVARNSIWIYLWHIPMIEAISLPFHLKYPVVFAAASLGAYLQTLVVNQILLPRISDPSSKKNVSLIFTG